MTEFPKFANLLGHALTFLCSRIFLLMGKTTSSLKIEKSFHVLTIKAIHAISDDEVVIHLDDGIHKKKINMKCTVHSATHLARQMLSAIKHYFPDFGEDLMKKRRSNDKIKLKML